MNPLPIFFSNIIDSKSVFTAKHSKNISELAYNTAKYLNYSEEKMFENEKLQDYFMI